jgi:rubrerythrin
MPDNIHRCPQVPENVRVLVTGGKIWIVCNLILLEQIHDGQCPYCGAVLVREDEGRTG